ncbi:MAG: sulfurtransferase TusA family protein [Deltaproteobacteria bacterium]|nr:sulfurtransferase TusA family protein [Deltaproteobacteria bacterium]
MSEKTKQERIDIDMRGQVCPACLLVAMDTMNKYRAPLLGGKVRLCIKTDNREAITTIPTTAQNMGYATRVTKMASYYEICVGLLPEENEK